MCGREQVGAIATALVEGPLELFRHQAQAGLISGNLFREMRNVIRTQVRCLAIHFFS